MTSDDTANIEAVVGLVNGDRHDAGNARPGPKSGHSTPQETVMSDFRDDNAVRIVKQEPGTSQAITVVVIRDKHLRDVQNTGVHVYAGSLPYAHALGNVARDLGAESGDTYTVAHMEDVYDIDVRYQLLQTD